MNISFVTPNINKKFNDVKFLKFISADGSIGVLNKHSSMIAELKKGNVTIVFENDKDQILEVGNGIVKIKNSSIIIISD